jgi:hypothetical protein
MPAVSGTVTVNVSGVVPVVTQASVSVSGLPVWMNPTQGVTILGLQSVNTIAAGFSVNALVTGVVSISVMPAVSISVSAVLGTIVTVLGTQLVTVVQASATPVWITGTVQAAAATTAVATTTASGASGVTGALVWVANPTQLTVTVTIAGTTTGTVSILNVVAIASQMTVGTTGNPVWLGMSQTIMAIEVFKTPIVIRLPVSAAVAPDTKIAFSIWAGGAGVLNTTAYAVPAGKNLCIVAMNIYAKTSAVISFAGLAVNAETATASMSVTTTMNIVAVCPYGQTAATAGFSVLGLNQNVAAGTTIGLLVLGGTTHSILGGVINGYLF